MPATARVVAENLSAYKTTCITNAITIKQSRLMMQVLAGGTTSTHLNFARECNVACNQYHTLDSSTCENLHSTHIYNI